jgi:hypothetical protein
MRMRGRPRAGLVVVALLAVVTAAMAACTTDPEELFTQTFELPAFHFEPMGQENSEFNSSKVGIPRPPGDIAVKRITWKMVDGLDNEIPVTNHDIHFHHVVLFNNGHPEMACPGSTSRLGGRWAAPGGERTPFEMPNGYGYFTDADDVWSATWHLMNLSDKPQYDVRVQYTVTWATDRSTLSPVTPYWLDSADGADPNNCGNAGQFTVPGGEPEIYTRTQTFTLPRSGVIKAVRSHMHAGGIDVTLTKIDGTPICKGTPVYHAPDPPPGGHDHGEPPPEPPPDGEHGHGGAAKIVAIPLCANLNIRVLPGERLRQVVRYDNVRQTGAMGSNLVWVWEDNLIPTTTTTSTTRPPTTRRPTTTVDPDAPTTTRTTRPPTTRTTTTRPPTTSTSTTPTTHGDHGH